MKLKCDVCHEEQTIPSLHEGEHCPNGHCTGFLHHVEEPTVSEIQYTRPARYSPRVPYLGASGGHSN